eukprot:maker-scaffold232_size243569-snap-gene-1.25 protein:Tk07020 transcript:maker-scaffold232_size243569-snap-gene-1.25-mRNA-1 annotation:"potassium voltage-gated channel protein shab-like isoform x5"
MELHHLRGSDMDVVHHDSPAAWFSNVLGLENEANQAFSNVELSISSDVYRTNMFHLSSIGCALVLQKDLEYWGIDELMMEPCCALKYYPEIEICVNEKQRQREKEQAEEEDFGSSRWGLLRSWLWNTMEYPWTSRLAQFVAFFSLGMVILSTLTFIISTMEEFQAMDAGESQYTTVVIILDYIDTFVIVFFTLEYLIRFVCAPRKWRFFKNPMNLVDLFSIIPFYVSMFLHTLEDVMIIGKAGKIVRLIRVMRILRIFKLVRHFAGLQSLFLTLRQAYKELGLLMLLVAVAILTFSSLVYFAEKEAATNSWTFVESFWWGLMTITTVGYDLNPKTFLGKLLGGFCALSGIFILTLPIPIVVNSFASYYKNRLWRNEVAQKKRERAQAQSAEAKEMQKFYLLKAMAMPMTGQDMIAPNDAVVRAGIKAAKGLRH